MKEELQTKLVEILGSIQTAADKAGDFAMAQLPDIAQSYVMYGRAYTLVIAVVALIVFCLGFYTVHLTNKKVKEADAEFQKDKEGANVYRSHYFEWADVGPLPYVPFMLGVGIFWVDLAQLLLVWFAPKVWLLKEIATFAR